MPEGFQIENPPSTTDPVLTRYLRSQMQRISQALVDLQSGGGGDGVPEAPIDGTQYGRQSAAWTPTSAGGATAWGDITGQVPDQLDLQADLNGKAALSHDHDASDIDSGTLDWARVPTEEFQLPIGQGFYDLINQEFIGETEGITTSEYIQVGTVQITTSKAITDGIENASAFTTCDFTFGPITITYARIDDRTHQFTAQWASGADDGDAVDIPFHFMIFDRAHPED